MNTAFPSEAGEAGERARITESSDFCRVPRLSEAAQLPPSGSPADGDRTAIGRNQCLESFVVTRSTKRLGAT